MELVRNRRSRRLLTDAVADQGTAATPSGAGTPNPAAFRTQGMMAATEGLENIQLGVDHSDRERFNACVELLKTLVVQQNAISQKQGVVHLRLAAGDINFSSHIKSPHARPPQGSLTVSLA